jgi:kynurenine formamidase
MSDPRDALMIGRTIKTTGITVLRADPSKGKDWWLCRCPCGREFVAHGGILGMGVPGIVEVTNTQRSPSPS